MHVVQGPTAALGLYINSGSVYENAHNAGASHLLEYLSFKSTQHRTHFRLTREVTLTSNNRHNRPTHQSANLL